MNTYYLWDEERLSRYLIFESLIHYGNCPSKCAICFNPPITYWKGTVWPSLISVYRWTKDIDRWNSCVSAQSRQGITRLKMARASLFFSGLIVKWKARFNSSSCPQPHPHKFFLLHQLLYGTFAHSNALFHAGYCIQLVFFTRIPNRYEIWSLCIVHNASGCDRSFIGK